MNYELFNKVYQWFFTQIKFDNYTLDFDSSVITRYGFQQGSVRGYNPTKPGRNSHHPLFASEISYQQGGWGKLRRVIIVKQQEELRPKATGKKLRTLFDNLNLDREKVYQTRYHAFVTNEDLPAIQIWNNTKAGAMRKTESRSLKKILE